MGALEVRPVESARDLRAFLRLPHRVYRTDPNWVAPLRHEARQLVLGRRTNPWFGHARAQLMLARREGRVVGRISAQIDELVVARRPRLGQWGLFEAMDAEAGLALIAAAEAWLAARGMTRAQGPMSLSIWDEPGLLVDGFDTRPTVMMGHHRPGYAAIIEAAGYEGVKDLHSWSVDIVDGFPERVRRIVAMGERNPRIRVREADVKRFDSEARIILAILNEAWERNWGFVPLTDDEVAHVGAKLKPIVRSDLVRIAELDGEPVAFMITLPDLNEWLQPLGGRLFPLGWARLGWHLARPRSRRMRVPLMGVRRHLQGSRLASMMAFMMIEHTRQAAVERYGAEEGEIGWILEDNEPMLAIAHAIEARMSRTYRIFERDLAV